MSVDEAEIAVDGGCVGAPRGVTQGERGEELCFRLLDQLGMCGSTGMIGKGSMAFRHAEES